MWEELEKKGLRKTRKNLIDDIGNFQITKENMTEEQQHHEKQVLKMRAKFLNSRIKRWRENHKKARGKK